MTNLCVENLICRLISYGPYQGYSAMRVHPADQVILKNFSSAVMNPKGLSTKQRSFLLRICHKYKKALLEELGPDVEDVIKNEVFHYPLYVPNQISKKIYIDGEKIILKMPYDEEIVKNLREYRDSDFNGGVVWDSEAKAWTFDTVEPNLIWIKNHLNFSEFEVGSDIIEYLKEIDRIISEAEQYAPMLSYKNQKYVFENVSNKVPQPTSNDVLENLFLARSYGISVWDENVQKNYKNEEILPLTDEFLKKNRSNFYHFNSNIYDIDQFKDLFKFYVPCIIVIPGHDELSFLKTWYNWLKTQNFENKNISVMFRLSSDFGKDFNEFVKDNNLNNSLSDQTKVVFISQKIPKPVLKSGINFNFVLNLGDIMGTHYTMSNFLSNNETITYSSRRK